MKIRGEKVQFGPASELIVFPRGDTAIAFRATAVLDRKEFEKYCPNPKPPKKRIKGGQLIEDYDSPKFLESLKANHKQYMNWLMIASLSVPGEKEGDPDTEIEWEKVKRIDKSTWHLYEEELVEAGLSDMERKQVFNTVAAVNSLNEARLDEARQSFLLHRQEDQEELSSQMDEQSGTPFSEPANDSESDPQESPIAGTISMKDSIGGRSRL